MIGSFVVRLGLAVFAKYHCFLVQEYMTLRRFQSQETLTLAAAPHAERTLQQELALCPQIALKM